MAFYKKFPSGLRLVGTKIEGLKSVTLGVLVRTGSANESESENGISHFIEHTVFKGTPTRSAFDISDGIDRIGAQINAFTSKETTCYYTKSTAEHLNESAEILSDLFFNATFLKSELEKEKGVIIEEINMSEDTPEDLCLDLLAESYFGKQGYGRTILGPAKNIRRFTAKDAKNYMDKYYTADNVVVSIAGDVTEEQAVALCEKYFANNFKKRKSAPQVKGVIGEMSNLYKSKKIEQTHLAICMKGFSVKDKLSDAAMIASTVLGGGMSSRLFQKIREELGLCYTVYSYPSQYKDLGIMEVYAGVNTALKDKAAEAIAKEIERFKKDGITEKEFLRGKEQIKSSFIMGKESTASQMLLYGKYMLFLNELLDYDERLKELSAVTIDDVHRAISKSFDIETAATATVGPGRKPIIL